MLTRREMLQQLGAGCGSLALTSMLHAEEIRHTLAVKPPHFEPKAKHVIWLFMNGGFSQVDTFDPKPMLTKMHGQPLPGEKVKTDRAAGNLMASPFKFNRYGKSGIEASEIFPQIGSVIDEFCVIRSMTTDIGNHAPSLYMMSSGHNLSGRPSLGSWLLYGLGTENQNLPGFVALCPGLPVVFDMWTAGFLPAVYHGVHVRNNEKTIEKLISNVRNQNSQPHEQRRQIDLITRLNRKHLEVTGPDSRLDGAIESMETAFRMQTEAPDAFDITKESEQVRARYGDGDFGRGCLMARRLVERGVRMVQVFFGANQPWDDHDDIRGHAASARLSDGPIAALIQDLKASGLLNETLVVIAGEFGRTPMIQNSGQEKVGHGRDHNVYGFTALLAGGGVKGGLTYGATDEFGLRAVENPVHIHDLHATILHLCGLAHTQLTYRYSGRDFRLTDVHGKIVNGILA